MLRKVFWFLLIVVLVLVFVSSQAEAGKGNKNKKEKPGKRSGAQAKDCSEWTFGECTVQGDGSTQAPCGKGTKKGTRTGDNCPVKEKSFPCRVPCVKNKCKYQKGEWSECDLATNMMSRTNTLKKGDATLCQASKVITRKCKNKKVNNRKESRRQRKPTGGSE